MATRNDRASPAQSGNATGLFEQTEDLITAPALRNDPEAAILACRRMLQRTRAGGDEDAEWLCLEHLGHLHWRVGRLEAALRYSEQQARLGHLKFTDWANPVKLLRALGKPGRALHLAIAALEAEHGRLTRREALSRAELCYQAALCTHLLGNQQEAIVLLERATAKLPKSLAIGDEVEARVLLQALRLLAGTVSAVSVKDVAQSALQMRSYPLAMAALAVVAWKTEDQEGLAQWRKKARDSARVAIGEPFCHDDWQQTHALLRAIGE